MVALALAQGAGLALGAVLQPGPLQAFLLARSTRLGIRRTLPAAFAPLLTDGPILLLVLVLLTQLPDVALRILQLAGGLFLLRLAWQALHASRSGTGPVADEDAGRRSLRDAVVLNLLNPNPYLFWGTVAGPLLLEAAGHSVLAAVAFVAGFYGLFVGGLCLTVVFFSALRRGGAATTRIAGSISALALAGFGVWQILRATGIGA